MTTLYPNGAYEHVAFAAAAADRALDAGRGIVRLAPAWVPREFCTPGRRIRLHPDDYYPFGKDRGGVDERWFSSTTSLNVRRLTAMLSGPARILRTHLPCFWL